MLGTSIAHLSATSGLQTVVKVRPAPGAVERCQDSVRRSLEHEVAAGRATPEDLAAALGLVQVTSEPADLGACAIVLECVPEQLDVKRRALAEAEQVLGPGQALASSTSAIRLAVLAEGLARPECFVGMHYFWPAHRRRLVEIGTHPVMHDSTGQLARSLALAQGIQVLPVRDSPGFLTSRIILAFFSEAIRVAGQGVPIEAIDQALMSFGWPMGAFQLMDRLSFGTLASAYDSMSSVLAERGEGARLFRALLQAGFGGRRQRSGFYLYEQTRPAPNPSVEAFLPRSDPGPSAPDEWARRPTHMLIHEAAYCLAEGVVAGWPEVELGATLGLAFPTRYGGGMLGYLHAIGWQDFVSSLVGWEARYGVRFRPHWQSTVQPPSLEPT